MLQYICVEIGVVTRNIGEIMDIIDEYMTFATYDDFYERRNIIKERFMKLDERERAIYRLYVYSNRLLSDKLADIVWEFLQETRESPWFVPTMRMEYYYKRGSGYNT